MKRLLKFSPIIAPLALAFSSTASAGVLGLTGPQDFIVRVGGSYMSPRQDQVSFVDETFQYFDAFRTTVDPDAEWGWYINAEWKPIEHWGIELSYTDGDKHASGSADGYFSLFFDGVEFGDVASFDADISTASLKFYPLDESCMVQPYIGGGISYTDFSEDGFRRSLRDELAEVGLQGNFDMGYSWGYTWQAGIDFNFGRDSSWLVNVAAVYARSVTDMRLQLLDDVPPPADVEPFFESYSGDYIYDPWMFNLSVGYKFSF
ncbi:OmpW family outer membrane protein [uncultured Microbulbifer sp.]|uniref:OmpW/AlkL family protein n=1 Tax=uncultured Microbulbifer sp. TaxID=348147 RepID=UPI0025E3D1E3|nr:OmpW family outer membrane protein [uncultured Microbulbifer sp.]